VDISPTDKHMSDMPRCISVFGLGYVGSVTAACLAHKGHHVVGVDINSAKVEMVGSGHSAVLEARLQELTAEGREACRLHATTDATTAVRESEISFVCVGTPGLRNGKLDLRSIENVFGEVGQALRRKDTFHTIVLRSTILPGTTNSLAIPTLEAASGKRAGKDFAVCVNPEFMREGSAVADFFQPPFTVLGAADPSHLAPLRELYHWVPGRIFETSLAEAEMVKYVCNAFHALKVSFANEVGTLCKQLGVDAEVVTEIFTSDTRLNISAAYLTPGFAFGGSCLPKDLRAITYRAKELDLRLPLLESVLSSNVEHIERAVEAVLRTGKRRVGILGLSFKAGTDDLRESPLVQLIKRLLGEGCKIEVWDPYVSLGKLVGSNRQFIEEVIPHIGSLLGATLREVVESAEVVLIGTREVESEALAACLRAEQIVIDLVNLENARRLQGLAFYEGICW
jgi:GDP-mannose 6-dehydrogenase